jgi:LEA14-like dessication related protein
MKKHKSIFFFFTFSFLLFVLAGCQQPQAPDYRGIESLVITKISANQSLVAGHIKFYNPNHYSLKMTHADVVILLEDKQAGHCIIDSTINIPKLDSFYVPVSVDVNLGNIVTNALQLLLKGKVKINAEGFVKLKKDGIGFKVPVHYEEYQKLDALLQQIQ